MGLFGSTTLIFTLADFPPALATMVVVPSPTAVTLPFSFTVATFAFFVVQVTGAAGFTVAVMVIDWPRVSVTVPVWDRVTVVLPAAIAGIASERTRVRTSRTLNNFFMGMPPLIHYFTDIIISHTDTKIKYLREVYSPLLQ